MVENNIKHFDLMVNTTTRVPVVFCIDTSFSMGTIIDNTGVRDTGRTVTEDGETYSIVEGGVSLIDAVTNGVNKFYETIRKNEFAESSCEVAIVTFNNTVQVVEEFSTVSEKKEFQRPKHTGETMMGAGIAKALQIAQERKKAYKDAHVDYRQPWLVLFTDGNPTDSIARVREQVLDLEARGKLSVYTIALADIVKMDVLQSFSKRGKPIDLSGNDLAKFFEFLGQSVGSFTEAAPDQIAPNISDEWLD